MEGPLTGRVSDAGPAPREGSCRSPLDAARRRNGASPSTRSRRTSAGSEPSAVRPSRALRRSRGHKSFFDDPHELPQAYGVGMLLGKLLTDFLDDLRISGRMADYVVNQLLWICAGQDQLASLLSI